MEKIDELEQRIEQLERELAESETRRQQLLDESEKTLDIAKHAYKVDHYGFIWVYEWQTKEYVKTDMRVMTPEIAERAIKAKHLADKCIEGRHMVDDLIEGRMIQDDTIDGRSIKPDAIGPEKIVDNSVYGDRFEHDALVPGKIADDAVQTRNIKNKNVTEPKLGDLSVSTRALMDKAVTPEKLNESVKPYITSDVDKKYGDISRSLDTKYNNITRELYSMIRSLQVGGIALSGKFGDRTDIGIHQKALTKAIGKLWDEIGKITGKTYMDFSLTVQPTFIAKEGVGTVTVTADCSEAISDFDSIKFYVNGELKAEAHDVSVYTQTLTIEGDGVSIIKAVGVIFGKTIAKEAQVTKAVPFFMGSGQNYQEVLVPECAKELIGTLEGDYDVTIKNNGDYMFIVIPISHKDEFRRADMNGLGLKVEIPMASVEYADYVVCKSLNTYKAGTYNIDIDINS